MADNSKIIDDYYSDVVSDSSLKDDHSGAKKKLKLVSKKTDSHFTPFTNEEKSKEKEDIKNNNIVVKQKKSSPKIEKFLEEKPVSTSKFIFKKHSLDDQKEKQSTQNQETIKNDVEEKKVFKFKKIEKKEGSEYKSNNNSTSTSTSFRKDDTKSNYKKEISKVPVLGETLDVVDGSDSKISSFKFKAPLKDKKDGKDKSFSSDEAFSKKKGLFKKGDNNRRVKDYLDDGDKELTFTRSNKINLGNKKEKKNIEEIVNQNLTSRTGEEVIISDVLSLKELSEKIGVQLSRLIAEFMKNGMMVNINSKIDFDSASIIAESFQIKLLRDNSAGISANDILTGNITDLLKDEDITKLTNRPPVISIMGHVDHGKTSLLDYIRNAKVADGEAGGITQSIGAYQVEHNGQKITFLDTPGHEAFTVMRARGAKSTDIAILVVAADEGVKPQTVESINHAREAGIPVVVAINKMDKEGANPDNVKSGLSENGLIPEDWGGDVPMIPVSARTGFGVDDLLGVLTLIAEMQDYKANRDRTAIATVIESHLDQKLGPVATVLINTGNIKKGDSIVCKDSFGKVKVLKDFASRGVIEAYPGDPVLIIGLDKVVEGGDILQVVADIETARSRSIEYSEIIHNQKSARATGIDLIMSKIKSGNLKNLKIVVKADTNGSLEAIKSALSKQSTDETMVSVIHYGVGSISESDILMCQGSQAILVGFRVNVLPTAKGILESSKVEFINSEIIYHITDKIEKIVSGMLDPKEVETILGKAIVGGLFFTSKEFMIIGLKMKSEGVIETKAKIRVIRGDKMIGKGDIASLKQGVEEVKRVEGPTECGIKFIGNCSPEIGDILEIYKLEYVK